MIDHRKYRPRTSEEYNIINTYYIQWATKNDIMLTSILSFVDSPIVSPSSNCKLCYGKWHVRKNITIPKLKQCLNNIDQIIKLKYLK